MTDRKLLIKRLLIFGGIGIVYFIWIKLTDLNIPCPVNLLSGRSLKCPGCGVTTMCLNLIAGNFSAAFSANPFLFIMLPIWGIFIAVRLIFAPKALAEGSRFNTLFYSIAAGGLIIFGIIRNIIHI